LQTWDLGTGKNFGTIDWDANLKTSNDPIFLYSGQFSKIDGSLILAGGSNANEAKLFDRNNLEKVRLFFIWRFSFLFCVFILSGILIK
jgi:hypothetical protein